MTDAPPCEAWVRTDELVALIARQAVTQGLTPSAAWPGLVFSRYEQRGVPSWEEVGSPSLCLVAQGRQRVRIGSVNYFADPFHALVMTHGLRFQAEILQASLPRPFLSFTLQVSPELVTEISEAMKQSAPALFHIEPAPPLPDAYVTTLDQQFLGAVQRFLLALESEAERGVLAPLHLREIVYRLLQSEQRMPFQVGAASVSHGNAITAAMAFMKLELHRPLSMRDLAEAVSMSESVFAHVFKAVTGMAPLQFLQQLRMEHARTLLLSGSTVREAAARVGYASPSHFSCVFKRHVGVLPRVYARQLRDGQDQPGAMSS